jgi:hypothetical protein
METEEKKLSELTDQELLEAAKKIKSTSIMNAVLIGFMAGVVIYSVIKSSIGFLTLIPLFIAYKLINNSKHNSNKEGIEKLLRERGLSVWFL